jgi:hypothetical protein
MHVQATLRRAVGLEEAAAVVRPHSPALHKPKEREAEVVGERLAPTADVAVEKELPALNAAGPKVTPCRDGLKVVQKGCEGFVFARFNVLRFD